MSYDLFQTIIPVFAVSISAPLSTWKNAVHILTTRSRESGGINVGKYAVDIASSNYVCTMGDTQSIDCHMTPSGSGINCYFNNGNVTGDIYLTFYLEDVLYYFYITDKTNDSDLRPQLSMDVDKYFRLKHPAFTVYPNPSRIVFVLVVHILPKRAFVAPSLVFHDSSYLTPFKSICIHRVRRMRLVRGATFWAYEF